MSGSSLCGRPVDSVRIGQLAEDSHVLFEHGKRCVVARDEEQHAESLSKWSFRRLEKISLLGIGEEAALVYYVVSRAPEITDSRNVYGTRALSCVGVLVPVPTPAAVGGQQLRIWHDGSSPHRTAQPSSSSPISAAADALMCESASAMPVSDSTISGWIVLQK